MNTQRMPLLPIDYMFRLPLLWIPLVFCVVLRCYPAYAGPRDELERAFAPRLGDFAVLMSPADAYKPGGTDKLGTLPPQTWVRFEKPQGLFWEVTFSGILTETCTLWEESQTAANRAIDSSDQAVDSDEFNYGLPPPIKHEKKLWISVSNARYLYDLTCNQLKGGHPSWLNPVTDKEGILLEVFNHEVPVEPNVYDTFLFITKDKSFPLALYESATDVSAGRFLIIGKAGMRSFEHPGRLHLSGIDPDGTLHLSTDFGCMNQTASFTISGGRFHKKGPVVFRDADQVIKGGPITAYRRKDLHGAVTIPEGTQVHLLDADYQQKLILVKLPSGAIVWVKEYDNGFFAHCAG